MVTAAMHSRVERGAVLALVLALHALLLMWWPRAVPAARGGAPPEQPVTVSIRLPPLRPEPMPPVATPSPAAPRTTRSATAPPAREATTPAAPGNQAAATPAAVPASAPTVAESSALDLRLSLPRGSAERGGLHLAPDSMVRQALNDPRANARSDPTQVLPRAVAESAKGDCMKGEYFTLAHGLLAVPFLAYAVAADHCKPLR